MKSLNIKSKSSYVLFVICTIYLIIALFVIVRIISPNLSNAYKVESALESFFIESPFNAFKEDSKYLKKTLTSLEAQSTDLSKVSNSLTSYLGLISRALTFMPIINYEFYGLSLQGERLQGGLETAIILLSVAVKAQTSVEFSEDGLYNTMANLSDRKVTTDISNAMKRYSYGDNGRNTYNLWKYAPYLSNKNEALLRAERNIETALRLAETLYPMLEESEHLIRDFEPIVIAWQDRDLDALLYLFKNGQISSTIGELQSFSFELEELISTLNEGDFDPELANLANLLLTASNLGVGYLETGLVLSQILDTETLKTSGQGLLNDGHTLQEVSQSLNNLNNEINSSILSLNKSRLDFESVLDQTLYLKDTKAFTYLTDFTQTSSDLLTLLAQWAPISTSFVNPVETKKILILGHSSDELRGTGGFVSSVWLLTLKKGNSPELKHFDAVEIDDWNNLHSYPIPPVGLQNHMNAWAMLMRDVSWDPHFPETAQIASHLFLLGQDEKVDGVIGINQWTILEIIKEIKGLKIPEEPELLTSQNFLEKLEEGSDIEGAEFINNVANNIFLSLTGEFSIDNFIPLAKSIATNLETGNLTIYSSDKKTQDHLVYLGWAGSIPDSISDYIFIVDSNVGWNKSDRKIERSFEYEIDLSSLKIPNATLTLQYTNISNPNSRNCYPQWWERTPDYGSLMEGCNWNYNRVYLPHNSLVKIIDPAPLNSGAVFVDSGLSPSGADTNKITSYRSKIVVSSLVPIEPGATISKIISYELPTNILVYENEKVVYNLYIQKQSGIMKRPSEINIKLPPAYELLESSHPTTETEDARIQIKLEGESNEHIKIVLSNPNQPLKKE